LTAAVPSAGVDAALMVFSSMLVAVLVAAAVIPGGAVPPTIV
jgi:hypothetical protein